MADDKGKDGKGEPLLTPKGQELVDKATAKAIETGKKAAGFLGGMFKRLDAAWNAPAPAKPAPSPKPAPAKPAAAPSQNASAEKKRIALGPEVEESVLARWPEHSRAYVAILTRLPIAEDVRAYFMGRLRANAVDEVREWMLAKLFPSLGEDIREELEQMGGGARWANFREIYDAGLFAAPGKPKPGEVVLGETDTPDGQAADISFGGEGHLLTVAMTGGGKTQVHVLPNVMRYKGPLVVLDPKGECYRQLAWVRRPLGNVFPWCPFEGDIQSASFNPIDFVHEWEDAQAMADMLVPAGSLRDEFWNTATRRLLTGIIWFVAKFEERALRNLQQVHALMNNPKAPATPKQFDEDGNPLLRGEQLRERMVMTGDRNLVLVADSILNLLQSDTLLTSFVAIAENALSPWSSPRIARVTETTTPGWDPAKIWNDAHFADVAASQNLEQLVGTVGRGLKHSVFLIVPPHMIGSFASVLRVIIGITIKGMIGAAHAMERQSAGIGRFPTHPVMFMLDELPQLGHLDQIENSITIVRSAQLRFWLFAQDLQQMQATYPKWGSMFANCRAKMFYAINDPWTAGEVGRFLGDRKELFSGARRPLMSPQELMGPALAGKQIILVNGVHPIRARAVQFRHDAGIQRAMQGQDDGAMPDWDEPQAGDAAG